MTSPYNNAWEALVAKTGSIEAARAEMKRRRSLVNPKNIKGYHRAARKAKKVGGDAEG